MGILTTKSASSDKINKIKKDLVNPKSMTPLNVLIDSELHRQFKIKTATDGMSMTDILVEAIQNYLNAPSG